MRNFWKAFLALAVIAAGVALWAPGPGASSEHFVVTNDNLIQGNNTGTVWKLENPSNPQLISTATLPTGGSNFETGGPGMNETAIARHGADICVFISDNESADITSFTAPGYAKAGSFRLPGVVSSKPGLGMAARNDFLFANYTDLANGTAYIAVWKIRSGCMLDLASIYQPDGEVWGMAISPDGSTLVVTFGTPEGSIASFSVSADGQLTEHGPYNYYSLYLNATGVDITADGKYAVIAEFSYGDVVNGKSYTEVGLYPINSDGSLGEDIDFADLGGGTDASWIRISPDEKLIFVSGASDNLAITTLSFDESVPSITYSCILKLQYASGITPVMPTGSGQYLAATTGDGQRGGSIALYSISRARGCPSPVPDSPFNLGTNSTVSSILPWPPRPF